MSSYPVFPEDLVKLVIGLPDFDCFAWIKELLGPSSEENSGLTAGRSFGQTARERPGTSVEPMMCLFA